MSSNLVVKRAPFGKFTWEVPKTVGEFLFTDAVKVCREKGIPIELAMQVRKGQVEFRKLVRDSIVVELALIMKCVWTCNMSGKKGTLALSIIQQHIDSGLAAIKQLDSTE